MIWDFLRSIRIIRAIRVILIIPSLATVSIAFAADFSSTDYTVTAPVQFSGEYSTSNDFQLFGAISQIAIGKNTSADYDIRSGFLYFTDDTTAAASAAESVASAGSTGRGRSAAVFETIKEFIKDAVGRVVELITGECKPNTIGDINCDGRVDLVDFSILAFWQGKSNPPHSVDVSGNGVVGLADFSIVAHHWTDPEVLGKKVVRVDARKNEVYTLLFTVPSDERSLDEQGFSLFGNDFAQGRIGEEENGIARYQINSSDVFARNQNNEGLDSVAAALPAIATNHGMWIIISMIVLGIGVVWKHRKNF